MAIYPSQLGLAQRGKAALGMVAAPFVLRLTLGRRARAAERGSFGRGFVDSGVQMPPLLRGLLAIPRGRAMLRHAATYAWHWRRAQQSGMDFMGPSDLAGNLFTAWTGPKLSFLHVEKSAGTAIVSWLSAKFHPEQIDPDPFRDLPPHLFARAPALALARNARYPLVWGHYDVPTLRRLDAARLVFTVLREPCARLTSLYYFWHAVDPAKIDPEISFAVGYAHRLSFEEFLDCDDPTLTDSIDNVYVRRLTGLYATGAASDPLRDNPQWALREAIMALDSLAFVGISEHLDETAARLAALLGIAPPAAALSVNVTAENHADPSGWYRPVARAPLSEKAVAGLARRTGLDNALYAYACKKFDN